MIVYIGTHLPTRADSEHVYHRTPDCGKLQFAVSTPEEDALAVGMRKCRTRGCWQDRHWSRDDA